MPNIPGGRLKLVTADHKSDPAAAVREAQRLITAEKAVGLVGAADEDVSDALAEYCEKASVPFIDADSASLASRQRQHKFTFQFAADNAARAKILFAFFDKLRDDGKADVKTIALFHDKEPQDLQAAQQLRASAADAKISIIATNPHLRGSPAKAEARVQEMRAKADAIILVGPVADAAEIAGGIARGTKGAPLIAYPSHITDRAIGPIGASAQGLFYVNGFARDARDNDPNIAAINTLYRSFAKRDLDELAALQFTAALTLAFAINDARGFAPNQIAQRLSAARFPGDRTIMPWTQLAFVGGGQNIGADVVISQRQSEKALTVFPPKFATGAAQWKA
jgi:ABC-type branched-subunit amino acid transport system substrate-binding protein